MARTEKAPLSMPPPALAGREEEWGALADRCARARQGEGGLLWLRGEAGIGKTALLLHLRDRAGDDGFRVLCGQHLGHRRAPPLHGLRQALSQFFALSPADGPAEVEHRIGLLLEGELPGLSMHRRALLRFLEPLLATGESDAADGQPGTLYHLLFRLFAVAARNRPLLLLLDDCQWADAATADGLAYLVPLIAEYPILIVGAMRPEDAAADIPSLGAIQAKNAGGLTLSRLSMKAVTRMATACGLGGDAAFCRRLHRLTQGVPLFVEQWLLECAKAGPARAADALEQMPESTTQAIAHRLGHLDGEEKSLLQIAAVLGDSFSAEILQAVDGRPRQRILSLLSAIEERHRLIRSNAAEAGRPFAFHHPLFRQVLYDNLPQGLRQSLHGRAAEVLRAWLDERPELLFEVSHHYLAAHYQERAAEILFRAGQRAFALHACAEARAYFEQALEVADLPLRAQVREALGDAALEVGDPETARLCWHTALGEERDALRRCTLYRKLGTSWHVSDFDRQRQYFQLALRESKSHPDSAERALVLAGLMRLPPHPRDPAAKRTADRPAACAAEALRILRRHPRRQILAHFLIDLLPGYYVRDPRNANLKRKQRLVRRGIGLAEECEDWNLVIRGRMRLAHIGLGADVEASLQLAEEALSLAQSFFSLDHPRCRHILQTLLHWSLVRGDAERCAHYRRLLGLSKEECPPDLAPYLWQTHPRQAWEVHARQAHNFCARLVFSLRLAAQLTRLQRLAHSGGQMEEWRALIHALRSEYPAYFAHLPPVQWELEPACPSAPPPEWSRLGLEALAWQCGTRHNTLRELAGDLVEITPSSGVGLGWNRQAPCLLHRLSGDFVLQARIVSSSHVQRAGGLIVRGREDRFIRFASGVDHTGQLSLGWHDGEQLRYAGLGWLPDNGLILRLECRGLEYEGLVSADNQQWFSCGRLRFGDGGPVEVGLFAEGNYEHDFLQPFPILFADVHLWAAQTQERAQPDPRPLSPDSLYPLPARPELFHGMAGRSRAFRNFCRQLQDSARTSLPLLICGETGSGKELAAQAVHQLGQQRGGPYVPVNVAALPAALIESELFGHVKGAFTGATRNHPGLFAAAGGGTLFLDEIGDLPLELQARLLRVLDSGEIRPLGAVHLQQVEVRILAATHRDLAREVARGAFRQDLYFRFAEPLIIPSLRERREDLPDLVAFFIGLYGQGGHCGITPQAMRCLQGHDWPDNIRGLRQVIERAVHLAGEGPISIEHLNLRAAPSPSSPSPPSPARQIPPATLLRQAVLDQQGNIAALSRYFGVSRLTIYRWIERRGLDLDALRRESGS